MSKLPKQLSTALVCLIAILAYLYSSWPKDPNPIFTTNLDLKHKIINDVEVDNGASGVASPFLSNLFEEGQKWLLMNFNIWRFYQNLANPASRYIVLNSGLRKEEVATLLTKELHWTANEEHKFIAMDLNLDKQNMEGRFDPGSYLMPAATTPAQAYETIVHKFDNEVAKPYASSTANIINIDLALKIGSIIEREAGGKSDMRLISGIIWNRIFKNMNLEMDATLQYAKGNSQDGWWPRVKPEDKYINSPYNTYMNSGLPPTPISNVSIAAIQAALNPKKTSCLFYLHDRLGNIHCSVTYDQHLANIKRYYGK